MRTSIFILALLFINGTAQADGVPLKNGRYQGTVVIFELTASQKKVIERYRTCHLEKFKTMNVYTPYVFTLTHSQSQALKAKKGFSPRRFEVYETYRGFNDAGPHWNLALRFSEDQIEVPLDLVINSKEAKAAHEEQGWKPNNPCFAGLNKL